MDCNQTSNLLNAYVDKELSKSDLTLVESHLAECASCREELEDIRRLDARMRDEVTAPVELRSKVADKLEAARTVSPRVSLKEMLGMRFRIGLAAVVAAGLIVVGVMSTGGNAQAAYARMKKAVTQVTSMHLHLEFNGPIDLGDDDKGKKDSDSGEKNDAMGNMANAALQNLVSGDGPKSLDVWSQDNMFRLTAFGGIDIACKDDILTMKFGGSTFFRVAANQKDMHLPKNLGQELFTEFSKMQDEMKEHFNVVNRGTVIDNGRTLDTLEVTGKDDNGKHFRLMYWVDESTNLPAQFQVFGDTEKGPNQLVCTITCDYNEKYPDSLFEPDANQP
jgi:hypothetical protein